ncbi:50S ribosomal protein L11 methyltransferase [Pseudahrensia aquimaris]|uniref:Ribosomal protein L11 methyltransferase n=1 Tax=Pseudahrensia aquimaris TaxID=744461 RepID=A0ABW3FF92_9HYPH
MSQSRLYLSVRKPEAHHIASILDPIFEEEALSTALFEDKDNPGNWCWSVYIDGNAVPTTRSFIQDKLGGDAFSAEILEEKLDDIDWVSHTLRDLSPVSAGRFFVHGSHDRAAALNKPVAVEIDAGLAFGTGHHGTTAGCLDMLERILRRRRPTKAMDVGTGSGVLAIALAKATRLPVLATDIDAVSVKVARENARKNGTGAQIVTQTATGFNHPAFAHFGSADLIFANILARPLEALAHPLAQHLSPGGDVILSGLLPHQKARIVSAYRRQGLVLERAHIRDGWLTLLMNRP